MFRPKPVVGGGGAAGGGGVSNKFLFIASKKIKFHF